jgi:hypothetical protein
MRLAPASSEPRLVDAERLAIPATETRPVLVDGELAGLLAGFERAWRFRSLRSRFDALNGKIFCRADDAICAARGIAALSSPYGCRCARRSDAVECSGAARLALLRDLDTLLERDAA